MLLHSSISYPDRVVAALREVVPPFHFQAWTRSGEVAGCERIVIVALAPDGTVRGGYELGCNDAARDLFQDTLILARFFLKAQAQAESLFHPPTLRAPWDTVGVQDRAV